MLLSQVACAGKVYDDVLKIAKPGSSADKILELGETRKIRTNETSGFLEATHDGTNFNKLGTVVSAVDSIVSFESCRVNGVSGTPVIDPASGLCDDWVSAPITDLGVGDYTVTIDGGIFNTIPTCTCGSHSFARCCQSNATSTTSVTINMITCDNNSPFDGDFTIYCRGKK